MKNMLMLLLLAGFGLQVSIGRAETVATFAGTGTKGFSGDGGAATEAPHIRE